VNTWVPVIIDPEDLQSFGIRNKLPDSNERQGTTRQMPTATQALPVSNVNEE